MKIYNKIWHKYAINIKSCVIITMTNGRYYEEKIVKKQDAKTIQKHTSICLHQKKGKMILVCY